MKGVLPGRIMLLSGKYFHTEIGRQVESALQGIPKKGLLGPADTGLEVSRKPSTLFRSNLWWFLCSLNAFAGRMAGPAVLQDTGGTESRANRSFCPNTTPQMTTLSLVRTSTVYANKWKSKNGTKCDVELRAEDTGQCPVTLVQQQLKLDRVLPLPIPTWLNHTQLRDCCKLSRSTVFFFYSFYIFRTKSTLWFPQWKEWQECKLYFYLMEELLTRSQAVRLMCHVAPSSALANNNSAFLDTRTDMYVTPASSAHLWNIQNWFEWDTGTAKSNQRKLRKEKIRPSVTSNIFSFQ